MAQFRTVTETVSDQRLVEARLQNPLWGSWVYEPKTRLLTCAEHQCSIALEEVTDSAELLDCIFQVRAQPWATPPLVADFLEALDFLLSPRTHYGTQNLNRSFDVRTHLERLNQRMEQAKQGVVSGEW